MTERIYPKIAYLDTNTLHFVSLYLEQAKTHNLYPLGGATTKAADHIGNIAEKGLQRSLKKGLGSVKYLLQHEVRVEYSPASELELLVGRARGMAIENAAREGIPDRMWTRFHDKEIGARLIEMDLTHIRGGVADLGSRLEKAGIDVTISDSRKTNEILELARDVTGLVYMGVTDSVIYASALVAEADYLIADDEYLRNTTNHIRGGQQPFSEITRLLRDRVAKVLSRVPGQIMLPEGLRGH